METDGVVKAGVPPDQNKYKCYLPDVTISESHWFSQAFTNTLV